MKQLVIWFESWLAYQRDTVNCLVVILTTLPPLLLIWSMQSLALLKPEWANVYRPGFLLSMHIFLSLLIAGLVVVAVYCWKLRLDERARPCMSASVLCVLLISLTLCGIAYGYKDTPLAQFWLGTLLLGRVLLGPVPVRCALGACVILVSVNEWQVCNDTLSYAPILSKPVFTGEMLAPWWSFWLRVLYNFAALPLCALFFLLFDIFYKEKVQLEMLARTDVLTGLSNRRTFMSKLEVECHRHARSKRPFCIMMCDVDHFKKVNDTWGHPAGDKVLAYLGQILREKTRKGIDIPARYGGEEFVVLFPETELSQAQIIAEKLHEELRGHEFYMEEKRFNVTQSVGIAQVNDGDGELGLRTADKNLYKAKNSGRNQTVASMADDPLPTE